jgi:hypothetical protein
MGQVADCGLPHIFSTFCPQTQVEKRMVIHYALYL